MTSKRPKRTVEVSESTYTFLEERARQQGYGESWSAEYAMLEGLRVPELQSEIATLKQMVAMLQEAYDVHHAAFMKLGPRLTYEQYALYMAMTQRWRAKLRRGGPSAAK